MSLYSWSLLNAGTIIKHALAVFHLQSPQTPLQRLSGEMHSQANQFTANAAANVRQSGVGYARKALAHLRMP